MRFARCDSAAPITLPSQALARDAFRAALRLAPDAAARAEIKIILAAIA